MIAVARLLWLIPLLLVGACRKEPASGADDSIPEAAKRRVREDRGTAAKVDPHEIVRMRYQEVLAFEEGPKRQKALAGVAWDALELDPGLAQQAFEELDPGSQDAKRLVGHFAMRMADEDPAAAIDWARRIEDDEERSEALARAAVVWSNTDPEGAGLLVLEEILSGRSRDRASVQIVQRWSQSDPEAALKWATALDSRAARQTGTQEAVDHWIREDPKSVIRWVEATEEGSPRVEALVAVAGVLIRQPEPAQDEFLELIEDEALRGKIEARVRHALEQRPPRQIKE